MIHEDAYDDDGRSFAGLDARETQGLLREEFTEGEMSDEKKDKPTTLESPADFSEDARAEHVRMAEAVLFAAVEPLDEAAIAARLPAGADIAASAATPEFLEQVTDTQALWAGAIEEAASTMCVRFA